MPDLFHLLTTAGQRIVSTPTDQRLVHALPGQSGAVDVVALLSPHFPQRCFLLSAGAEPVALRCGHPNHRAAALAMHLHRQPPDDGAVSLMYVVNRKYLCARPATSDDPFGTVWADHDDPGPGRIFTLASVASASLPAPVLARAEAIESVFAERADPAALLARLDSLEPAGAAAALDAVLPALTMVEIDALAAALRRRPERIAELARLLRQDVWAAQALPKLAASLAPAPAATTEPPTPPARPLWQRLLAGSREPAAPASKPSLERPGGVLGAEYDEAALPQWRDGFVSSAQTLNAALRAQVEPRRTVCIVAPARNEGVYLLEWIAYHRAIGVEAFFLYTNDNQDSSDELLEALARAGVITWFDNRVGAVQSQTGRTSVGALGKCYGHALSIMPEVLEYRWAAVMDLDEYVVLEPTLFGSLPDYLQWQELQDVDAISLNWMFMRSASGGALDGPLTARCLQQSPEFDRHVKSLCRPRRFVHSTSHFPLAGDRRRVVMRDAGGGIHRYGAQTHLDAFEAPALSERPVGGMAWINHYFFKSAEEYMWKFSRNRGGTNVGAEAISVGLTPDFLAAFMRQLHESRTSAQTPLVAHHPAMQAKLAELMALPGIAAALDRVRERYASRLASVRALYREAPVLRAAGAQGEEFLALAGAA